jgi:hypothetical protein
MVAKVFHAGQRADRSGFLFRSRGNAPKNAENGRWSGSRLVLEGVEDKKIGTAFTKVQFR